MKLITLNQFQVNELKLVHPQASVASYAALISEQEYSLWVEYFSNLTSAFIEFFNIPATYSHILLNKLPIFHWTSKLVIPTTESGKIKDKCILQPKAYKIGVLSEGTYKDFGYQVLLIHLLNNYHSMIAAIDFLKWDHVLNLFYQKTDYLGVLSWSEEDVSMSLGDRYLALFLGNCINDVSEIEIEDKKAKLHNKNYTYVIPSYHYFNNDEYQKKMLELNKSGLLVTPLNFLPARIETFLDFRHENWASVFDYPGDGKFKKSAESSGEYLLIRRDGHKIYSWLAVQSDPILRLALGMEDEWLWQEACSSPFPDLNLYWSPALEYPWLVNRKTKEWVPALITKESLE